MGEKQTGAPKACMPHLQENAVMRDWGAGHRTSTVSQQENKGLGEKGQDRALGLEPLEMAKSGWHRLVEAAVFQEGLLRRVLGAVCGQRTV